MLELSLQGEPSGRCPFIYGLRVSLTFSPGSTPSLEIVIKMTFSVSLVLLTTVGPGFCIVKSFEVAPLSMTTLSVTPTVHPVKTAGDV